MSKKNASKRSATPVPKGSAVDFEAVRELARIAIELDLASIEVDGAGLIRVTRGAEAPAVRTAALAPAPAPAPAAAPAAAEDAVYITSPFVGTFYRAPSPEADPFVDAGHSVRKGQVVCIIEAMKLMNEIESETEGKVVEVLAKNGDHVEYGQRLFRLQRA
jgi:acetyl-CoA carboxylase biotin carboxyl carrier protein